ncbi:MAG: glycine betaine ABC transporter substrate-binding protein [Bryobacteraceae bacterium]
MSLIASGCVRRHELTVGSKNFTEQVILGEIVAQHLENRMQQKIGRRLNLGGTLLVHQSVMNGEIDVYPEYSGTALSSVLKINMINDRAAINERIRDMYRSNLKLEWLDPLGFNNTFVMAVRDETAARFNLKTLSDAEKPEIEWRLGVGYEFEQRPDGLSTLNRTYHFRDMKAPVTMDLGLIYRALEQKQVNMIAANSTDGLLAVSKVKVLADDRHAFPPYDAALVARADTIALYPKFKPALDELAGKFPEEVMRKLNYEVDGSHTAVAEVAAAFLRKAGLH